MRNTGALMAKVTKTVNPLHLEDLEPHRFEDLVRQLLYDFRRWRRLEATGRSGADDGFDARGWEIVASEDSEPVTPALNDAAEDDSLPSSPAEDRLWLIQCKRERKIGPSHIAQYVADIPEDEAKNLHGTLFAAACDFSKKARDAFREACAARGIEEWHLWGKAEIEDRLFQPANDHLLFAYFGFSLRIRKRSLKTQLTSRLAIKRRVAKLLGNYEPVLIRDATDDSGTRISPTVSPKIVCGVASGPSSGSTDSITMPSGLSQGATSPFSSRTTLGITRSAWMMRSWVVLTIRGRMSTATRNVVAIDPRPWQSGNSSPNLSVHGTSSWDESHSTTSWRSTRVATKRSNILRSTPPSGTEIKVRSAVFTPVSRQSATELRCCM